MTAAVTDAAAAPGFGSSTHEDDVMRYQGLVRYVVGRLPLAPPAGLEYDDLVGFGNIGLLQALERFDPSRGVVFQSFAVPRIRGAILDAIRKYYGVPRSASTATKRLHATEAALAGALGRAPTKAELAESLGTTASALEATAAPAGRTIVSLDALLETPNGETVARMASQHPDDDVAGRAEHTETLVELRRALEALEERDQRLLSLYYVEELTMNEIGEILGISEGRVCQLHARALQDLRAALHLEPAKPRRRRSLQPAA
jgi:RNA polymerase sigma factor for flagellar operon FliA